MKTKLISSTLIALLASGVSFSAHAAKPLEANAIGTVAAAGAFTQYFSFTTTSDYLANKESLYVTGISGASLSGPFTALSLDVIKDATHSSGFIAATVPVNSASLQATFKDSAYASWDLLANTTYTVVVKGITNAANSQYNVHGNYLTSITPVPEPESYAMLLAGLGLMGTIARRRRKASKA